MWEWEKIKITIYQTSLENLQMKKQCITKSRRSICKCKSRNTAHCLEVMADENGRINQRKQTAETIEAFISLPLSYLSFQKIYFNYFTKVNSTSSRNE